jgi:hypothetical protein
VKLQTNEGEPMSCHTIALNYFHAKNSTNHGNGVFDHKIKISGGILEDKETLHEGNSPFVSISLLAYFIPWSNITNIQAILA